MYNFHCIIIIVYYIEKLWYNFPLLFSKHLTVFSLEKYFLLQVGSGSFFTDVVSESFKLGRVRKNWPFGFLWQHSFTTVLYTEFVSQNWQWQCHNNKLAFVLCTFINRQGVIYKKIDNLF
jgi:hypothetical protein